MSDRLFLFASIAIFTVMYLAPVVLGVNRPLFDSVQIEHSQASLFFEIYIFLVFSTYFFVSRMFEPTIQTARTKPNSNILHLMLLNSLCLAGYALINLLGQQSLVFNLYNMELVSGVGWLYYLFWLTLPFVVLREDNTNSVWLFLHKILIIFLFLFIGQRVELIAILFILFWRRFNSAKVNQIIIVGSLMIIVMFSIQLLRLAISNTGFTIQTADLQLIMTNLFIHDVVAYSGQLDFQMETPVTFVNMVWPISDFFNLGNNTLKLNKLIVREIHENANWGVLPTLFIEVTGGKYNLWSFAQIALVNLYLLTVRLVGVLLGSCLLTYVVDLYFIIFQMTHSQHFAIFNCVVIGVMASYVVSTSKMARLDK
tara:strand:+ start:1273 stop:2379 length:1107 start_codon:yes stop_codon:yes gene_type:complete